MTSQPTNPNHIQQTLFAEDFHVQTSQLLDGKKASQRLQGLVSSSNSSQPYAWFDQNTSSWKTYQRSLLTEWTLYLENFTRQGTMQNGVVSQVALLELATKEIDGGLLPTPLASDPDRKAKFKQGGTPLRGALDQEMFNSLLPTPRASDMEGGTIKDAKFKNGSFYRENKKGEKFGIKLRDAVSILPTPTATTHKQGVNSYNNKNKPLLAASVLPTPRAAKGMGMKLSKGMANLEHKKYLETEIAAKVHTHGEVQNTDLTQTGENIYLNPQFVEEMMGYPLNWTLNNEFRG